MGLTKKIKGIFVLISIDVTACAPISSLQEFSFSVQAASAAQCAYEQGMFWEYHELLIENPVSFSTECLKTYASMLNLDRKEFDKCLDDN